MKKEENWEKDRQSWQDVIKVSKETPDYIKCPACGAWLEVKHIIEQEKEECFDTLMSCIPKTAENISTITPEDARKMLQDFVNKYWENQL